MSNWRWELSCYLRMPRKGDLQASILHIFWRKIC